MTVYPTIPKTRTIFRFRSWGLDQEWIVRLSQDDQGDQQTTVLSVVNQDSQEGMTTTIHGAIEFADFLAVLGNLASYLHLPDNLVEDLPVEFFVTPPHKHGEGRIHERNGCRYSQPDCEGTVTIYPPKDLDYCKLCF